ncbi:unnamed protein product [Dracunculus medinensis]|uniref:Apple domain-containing protein n=1 Tax=Dracunculus medinensis TaxID=318479 RepID=A0A0N4UDY3_DRAME|nr:unnamed protein product [Dracunculus medinensis]
MNNVDELNFINSFFAVLCVNRVNAFFVVDNARLDASAILTYEDISEDDCSKICGKNRDKNGRFILCSAFTYDHSTFKCLIHQTKSIPEGDSQIENIPEHRYFEKFCIDEKLPVECADTQFLRAEQSVLIGFARNVSLTANLAECVTHCLMEKFECKSAMYFYEEGECITNIESASTQPNSFAKEENDKVIYFQNGCTESMKFQRKYEAIKDHLDEQFNTHNLHNEEMITDFPIENDENENAKENDDYQMNRNEKEEILKDEKIATATTTTATITTKISEYQIVQSHNVVNDSKNLQIEDETKLKIANEQKNKDEIITTGKYLKKLKMQIIKSDSPRNNIKQKNKYKTHPRIITTKKYEKHEYFSQWSEWPPCKKIGEKRVRYRKCYDLRLCLGALMEINPVERNKLNITPFTPLPFEGILEETIGATQKTMVNRNNTTESPNNHNQIWSSWAGECQAFTSGQPCKDHEMIGFESRECIAKDPNRCVGPFFRYCTIPC